jgi:hypothetical protein
LGLQPAPGRQPARHRPVLGRALRDPAFHLRIETLPTCLDADGTSRHEPLIAGPHLLWRFDGTHAYRNPLLEEHNRGTTVG